IRQGFVENSSEAPFEDYLVQGMGKSPLVMIYEAQFLARQASGDGSVTADMQLVYPEPTILSKHTFVGLTPDGQRMGQFLESAPGPKTLSPESGFRPSARGPFKPFIAQPQPSAPESLIDVIAPPTYETLEALITRIQQIYGGPAPTSSPLEGASP